MLIVLVKMIAKEPNSAHWHNELAWSYAEMGIELDRGIELSRKSLELKPDEPNYLDTLAELYHKKGQRQKAIEAIKKAMNLDPQSQYFRKQLEKFEAAKQASAPVP